MNSVCVCVQKMLTIDIGGCIFCVCVCVCTENANHMFLVIAFCELIYVYSFVVEAQQFRADLLLCVWIIYTIIAFSQLIIEFFNTPTLFFLTT